MPAQARQLLGIQRQRTLHQQDSQQQHKAQRIEQQDRQQIVRPAHLRLLRAQQSPQWRFQTGKERFVRHQGCQPPTQRLRQQHQQHQIECDE